MKIARKIKFPAKLFLRSEISFIAAYNIVKYEVQVTLA